MKLKQNTMTNNHQTLPMTWGNMNWILDARRVLVQPENKLLILSDIHIGYYSSLRSMGGYLPAYDAQILNDTVESLLQDYQDYHWIIAGDIKHTKTSMLSEEELNELRQTLGLLSRTKKLTIILGNHDRGLESILKDLDIQFTLETSMNFEDITITHNQDVLQDLLNNKYIIGHFHPTISVEYLRGLFVPVFAVSDNVIILPAFNYVAGGYNIRNLYLKDELKRKFLVYAVSKQIYNLGSLEKLL